MKNPDRMKTVIINGVPYRMRGDMKIPEWRKSTRETNYHNGYANDPFRKGHMDYLTTPEACEKKREKEGDGVTRDRWTGKALRYDAVEEQVEMDWNL